MAAPATTDNVGIAVQKLHSMFPQIAQSEIQRILLEECSGETTRAIVVLTRIQEFNQSVPNSNNNNTKGQTGQSFGENNENKPSNIALTIQPSQNVLSQPPPQSPSDECCNCASCCTCCLMKPALYLNGIYEIDRKMYCISFILLFAFNIYSESAMDTFQSSNYGLYLPSFGLTMILIASLINIIQIYKNKQQKYSNHSLNYVIGSLFIFGGLLYFMGYIIHAALIRIHCGNSYRGWYYYDCHWYRYIPTDAYLIGRGFFIGLHAMFYGLLCSVNDRMTWFHSRNNLVTFWSVLFLMFSVLVLAWFFKDWQRSIIGALVTPYLLVIAMVLTIGFAKCKRSSSTQNGGCNSMATMGIISVSLYWFCAAQYTWQATVMSVYNYDFEDQIADVVLYRVSLLLFGGMQLWILTRAMHPVASNCGCDQDGADLTLYLMPQNTQIVQVQQPVVMVPVEREQWVDDGEEP